MSEFTDLKKVDLAARLSHHFENLLIDSCRVNRENGASCFKVNLAPGDPQGRKLFLKQGSSGSWFYL